MTRYTMADLHKRFSDDIKHLNPDVFGHLGVGIVGKPEDLTPQTVLHVLDDLLKGDEWADREERKSKYGAKKTKIGDLIFDSQKEARRYLVLKSQEEAGEIKDLILQCRITLLEGFTYQGQKVRAINYTADFVYQKEGKTVVEDVKSTATARTEAFRIRWRLLQWYYRDRDDVVLLLTD